MKRLLFTLIMIISLTFTAYGQSNCSLTSEGTLPDWKKIETNKDQPRHCFCSCHSLTGDLTGVIAVGGGSEDKQDFDFISVME